MSVSTTLDKIANGISTTEAERAELRREADNIDRAAKLVSSWVVPGTTIPYIRDLKTSNVRIDSGEIQLGSGTPGDGFSGVRIGFPAFEYDGEEWNIAGIDNDSLQVGIRASDGRFRGGSVSIDDQGMWIDNQQAAFGFEDTNGDRFTLFFYSSGDDWIGMQNDIAGRGFETFIKFDDSTSTPLMWSQDDGQSNRSKFHITEGAQGARLSLGLGHDAEIFSRGVSGGATYMRLSPSTITPPTPSNTSSGVAPNFYVKGTKFIIQYEEGGTVRYKYLELTGTGVTWVHTTTPP